MFRNEATRINPIPTNEFHRSTSPITITATIGAMAGFRKNAIEAVVASLFLIARK